MSTVISVEHLSKTYPSTGSGQRRLGQVSTGSTRRIGAGAFSRDLEAWWAKLCGAWRPIPCCALAKLTTLDGYGIIVCMESEK